jgi:hypothetical protein
MLLDLTGSDRRSQRGTTGICFYYFLCNTSLNFDTYVKKQTFQVMLPKVNVHLRVNHTTYKYPKGESHTKFMIPTIRQRLLSFESIIVIVRQIYHHHAHTHPYLDEILSTWVTLDESLISLLDNI